MTINLGGFTVPAFDAASTAFGAERGDYPKYEDIPEQHRTGRSPECKIFERLFFEGGDILEGRKMRDGFDKGEFCRAFRAYACSWAPKHEVKTGACAWLIETCTELAQ